MLAVGDWAQRSFVAALSGPGGQLLQFLLQHHAHYDAAPARSAAARGLLGPGRPNLQSGVPGGPGLYVVCDVAAASLPASTARRPGNRAGVPAILPAPARQ